MNLHPILEKITLQYEDLSPVEQRIADFILTDGTYGLPPARELSKTLFVSEAALTRFAKRCGFRGFRELSYAMREYGESTPRPASAITGGSVVRSYRYMIERTAELQDEEQLRRIVRKLREAEHILVGGVGYSGIVARECHIRLRRIGMRAELANETHLIRIMASLTDEKSLMIALSVSGATKEIAEALRIARAHGAGTILITSAEEPLCAPYCDEILKTASIRNLDAGTLISPQLPHLIVFDLLYSRLVQEDYEKTMMIHSETVNALGVRDRRR